MTGGEATAVPTPLWTAGELRAAVDGRFTLPFAATGVSIDTRTLRPGDLFVALRGENGDGHDHIGAAFAAGAAGAMVHRDVLDGHGGRPLLQVPDTLAGLHALGAAGRGRFAGRVIAVTGSVGKTTTKEMLRRALAPFGAVHAAEASYNNHWGVPLTLARLPADAAFCVAEIGMNQAGEILPLARLTAPHLAVITHLAAAHIGHLGSMEAIADEKASILGGLTPGGTAVLPAETKLLPRLLAAAADAADVDVRLFGSADAAGPEATGREKDAVLVSASGDARTCAVRARLRGRDVAFALAAPGRHMAMNAVATLACVDALGGPDVGRAAAALDGFAAVAGRGAQRELPGGIRLLDESYNASGASVRAALAVLGLTPARRRVAVLGDMLELGEHGPAEHASLAPDVAASADLLFACGPLTRGLFDAAPAAMRAAHEPDSAALAPVVAKAVRPGDAVLVKGSLGSRMRLIVQALEARAAALASEDARAAMPAETAAAAVPA